VYTVEVKVNQTPTDRLLTKKSRLTEIFGLNIALCMIGTYGLYFAIIPVVGI